MAGGFAAGSDLGNVRVVTGGADRLVVPSGRTARTLHVVVFWRLIGFRLLAWWFGGNSRRPCAWSGVCWTLDLWPSGLRRCSAVNSGRVSRRSAGIILQPGQ